MLAFLLADAEILREFLECSPPASHDVDGPFQIWQTDFADEPCRLLFLEEGGADAAYAAVRLLRRRGADALVLLTPCQAAPALWARSKHNDEARLERPPFVCDGRGLAPLLEAMPSPATQPPFAIDPSILSARRSLPNAAKGPGLLTLESPLRAPALADALLEAHDIGYFDLVASGAADAAVDESVALTVMALPTGAVRRADQRGTPRLERDLALRRTVRELLGNPRATHSPQGK